MADTSPSDEQFINETFHAPIVLVGMMGVGKSRVGRALADVLDRQFHDSDAVIESETGTTISEIFARSGEAAFRDREQATIARLMDEKDCVIAVGGGALMRADTAESIRTRALSVWVRAEPRTILDRIARHGNRPLLQTPDPERTLDELMRARLPSYSAADLTVDNDAVPLAQIMPVLLRDLADCIRRRA